MITRRQSLKAIFGGLGATGASSSLIPQLLLGDTGNTSGSNYAGAPRRVVFFLQNQGFDPKTCIPVKMAGNNGSLAGAVLPSPIKALEPFKEKLHIIDGLHGRHTNANHSAYFGALGGYRGSDGVPPSAATIDYDLSQILPPTLLPHLSIGMDSLEGMKAKPTVANLSASGAGKPIYMHSNPNHLYQLLYGSIAQGDIRTLHEAQTTMLSSIHGIANQKGKNLPAGYKQRYSEFLQGFDKMDNLRTRLANISDHLKKFAPQIDNRYLQAEFETDWHDALLELGISALKSGTTNVLTIGSGRGEVFGSWKGLGIDKQGHNLGHMPQYRNPIWDKIRNYNMEMLVKIIEELESVPEGSGTMMDNTLIVYTSNNAEKQHTKGANWPVMLIGNCGGAFKSGRFTQLDGTRPINALYASILKTAGQNIARYNMSDKFASGYDSSTGPLQQIIS